MILAIIERVENIKERAPFNNRYYLTEYYKNIFDELKMPYKEIVFFIGHLCFKRS